MAAQSQSAPSKRRQVSARALPDGDNVRYKLSIKNTVLYYLHLHGASKGRTFELIVKKSFLYRNVAFFIDTCRKKRSIDQCRPSWIDSVAGTRPR